MAELSNRTLAGLLVIAIVISVIGTLFSINKVGQLAAITGMATSDSAKANVTIQGVVALNATNNIVFGSGTLAEGGFRTINTHANNIATGGFHNCIDYNMSHGNNCTGIVIENTGNVNINVTVNASAAASSWIGGTGSTAQFNATAGNASSGTEQNGCTTSGQKGFANVTTLGTTKSRVCSNLSFTDGADKVTFELFLSMGPDTTATTKTVTLTFQGNQR